MTNTGSGHMIEYASSGRAGRVSRLGVSAMILGIISMPTVFLAGGLVLGPIALILGIISVRAINRNPQQIGGKGFAIAGITTGICGLMLDVLIIATLVPLIQSSNRVFYRSPCAANITGTIKGFVVYANDNNDYFPTPGLPASGKAYPTTTGTVVIAVDQDAALTQVQTTPGAQGNPLSALWMLVLRSQASPKNLICRTDPAAYSSASPMVDASGRYYLNPAAGNQVSYSIAYPYASTSSVGDWWKNTMLSDLPIMSDMAPLNGTGKPKRDLAPGAIPSNVKTVNSGNHNGDGQEVGFADAHCEWKTNPLAGQGGENIWTVGTVTPAAGGYVGSVITGGGVPNYPPSPAPGAAEAYDTIMVPVRDLGTGAIR